MTKKNVMLAGLLFTVILAVVVIVVTTNQPGALSECDVYLSFENAKSVFGGYVPEYCKN